MNAPNIHIEGVSFAYQHEILFEKINCLLPKGQWTALLGPSGVGKSTLLRMIAGLEKTNGRITADNALPLKDQVAYMAQADLLFPWLNVLENAALALRFGKDKITYAAGLAKAKNLLIQVGLKSALDFYPHQLSGGMRQRVALVRTLVEDKPIILMDEPFSALDAITRYKLQALAAELLKNKTVFFITHDPLEALRLAHYIYILNGKPATLKRVAHLHTPIPREIDATEITTLQKQLYQELADTRGDF